jgi:hypothetical protein
MENFFLFAFLVCIVILFNKSSKLKEENEFLDSLCRKNEEDYNSLKKEIDEIKKQITQPDFVAENLVAEIAEIEMISEQTQEVSPLIIPATFDIIDDSPQEEENIIIEESIEKPAFSFESRTIHILGNKEIIYEKETPELVENLDTQPIYEFEEQPEPEVHEEEIYVESAFSILIKKLEHQFAENWTGILGTAIMVLGIGYLSIYTALIVSPMFRILILWLYAGILVGSYFFLKKKEKWLKTGLWLRSAGASLFLFGCFGASQIPALTFTHNIPLAYSLIGIGIAINLYVGYIIKQQTFLSLHVILSILILCVIPEKLLVTFLLAAITATAGIILSYKEKWEYHLLIVISGFIIFDIWFTQGTNLLSPTQNIFAILGIILVSVSCMYMQYRSIYTNTRFDRIAFVTHLTNWILFALGLISHSTGSKIKIFVLLTAGILCLFAALFARKKKIFWLYHLDGMVSFILFALSIIMLNDWKVGFDIIACGLYFLVIACLFIVYKSKEVLLHKIFLVINHIFCLLVFVFFMIWINPSSEQTDITNSFATLIVMLFISLLVPVFCSIKKEFLEIDSFIVKKDLSLNGIFSVLFSIVFFISWYHTIEISFYFPLLFIALLWCSLRFKFKTNTFDFGRFTFLIITIATGLTLILTEPKSNLDVVFALGIISVITFNWFVKLFYTDDSTVKTIGIIAVNALLASLLYKYLAPYHIIQIFGLFVIALLNHEFLWIQFKRKTLSIDNQIFLYGFCLTFSIFASLLFLYNTQFLNNTEIGLIALGLSIIEIYILFAAKIRNKSNAIISDWGNYSILNSEFILFNALVFGFSCIQIEYIPVYLGGLALLTFWIFQKIDKIKRYNIYSFILLIGSILLSLYLAIYEANTDNKTVLYATQVLSVLLSIAYSYLQIKSPKEEGKMFIGILPAIQNLWGVTLLFIQVDMVYLPPIFMLLAILNLGLVLYKKIKLSSESVLIKRYNIYSFILLIGSILLSVYWAICQANTDNKTILYATQALSVLLSIIYSYLQSKNSKEEGKMFIGILPAIQNLWVVALLFIQVEIVYLPPIFMLLAILNIGLVLYKKKKLSTESVLIKRYNIYSFILLTGSILLSIYWAIYQANTDNKTILYSTQVLSVLLSIVYSYLQSKNSKEEGKMFITILPTIQNLWGVALLFIQVEIVYLSPIFMLLAILNLGLVLYKKMKLAPELVLIIGLLSILTSVFYSIKELNHFTALDWVLQLSGIAFLIVLVLLMNKKEFGKSLKIDYQVIINIWLSIIMFSQLEHKWLPVFWATTAIINLYLYYKKIGNKKEISIVYYLLANFHLAFVSFNYYESKFEFVYLIIFALLASYIFIIYKYIEDFKFRNNIIIYPATFSIGLFLYLSFDKGILTFFWILESLGLLILGIILKEKYFRYVSLSLVGVCVIRLMFFDLSNANFLIRALVLLGVGVVLLVMNTLFKKYKYRFD